MVEKIDTKALNEKLLNFAGVRFEKHQLAHHLFSSGYYYKGKNIRKTAPDLVHSLDTQAKYIYPKLRSLNQYNFLVVEGLVPFPGIYWAKIVDSLNPHLATFLISHENPAVAFALACEKLIDSLK
jgi:hypothetical protein